MCQREELVNTLVTVFHRNNDKLLLHCSVWAAVSGHSRHNKAGWLVRRRAPTGSIQEKTKSHNIPTRDKSSQHLARCSTRLRTQTNLFDRGEFLLALHGERPQVRLHVLQQFLHRFGAAGRHLWRRLRHKSSQERLTFTSGVGAQSPPPPHPFTAGI